MNTFSRGYSEIQYKDSSHASPIQTMPSSLNEVHHGVAAQRHLSGKYWESLSGRPHTNRSFPFISWCLGLAKARNYLIGDRLDGYPLYLCVSATKAQGFWRIAGRLCSSDNAGKTVNKITLSTPKKFLYDILAQKSTKHAIWQGNLVYCLLEENLLKHFWNDKKDMTRQYDDVSQNEFSLKP